VISLVSISAVCSLQCFDYVSWVTGKVSIYNKYVGACYRGAKMYSGHVACYPLLSHSEYADGTDRQKDGQMPDCHITL